MEVIILAGGFGTRLRSVVNEVPKCMAPIANKPFLWYLLKYLTKFDVSKLLIGLMSVKMSFLLLSNMPWRTNH